MSAANSSTSVCFLLGLPRSGTTLLAHLLQQHPDLLAPPEPWLMLALDAFGKVDRGHPADADLIQMATSEFFGRIDRMAAYRAFADAAYGQYLAAAGKRCFIDKTPRYWMATELIDTLYPEAPQIVLLRNPYAIAASLKSTWNISLLPDECSPSQSIFLADLVLGYPTLAARRHHPRTQVAHYEALVRMPMEEVKRLVSGLGYDPIGISSAATTNTEYLRTGNFGDRKIFQKSGVDSASIDAWCTDLTLAEMQAVTDMIGAELILNLGYDSELQHAYSMGVTDKGAAATQLHRDVYETWRSLRNSRTSIFEHHPLGQGVSTPTPPAALQKDVLEMEKLDLAIEQDTISHHQERANQLAKEIEKLESALAASILAQESITNSLWTKIGKRLNFISPIDLYSDADSSERAIFRAFSTAKALERIAARGVEVRAVIDVGASNGMWSKVTRLTYKTASYLLIEAQKVHESELINYCRDNPNTEYVLAAAGDKIGEIFFDDNDPFGGVASHEATSSARTVVPVTTIDHEVSKRNLAGPFLVKLDTHGFEVPILEGARETLRNAGLVVIETYNFKLTDQSLQFDEMCAYMRSLGFGVVDVSEPLWRKRDGAFWQMDLFFIPLNRSEFSVRTYT